MSYVPVYRTTFENEMTDMGFAHVDVKGTLELVYERKIPDSVYGVRILSTIDPRNGVSRDVGTDAIRVTLWNYTKDRPVKVERRVNRTGTEDGVLQRTRERAREVWGWATKNQCSCGNGVMVKRKGRNGEFFGCSDYPTCKNTKQIEE